MDGAHPHPVQGAGYQGAEYWGVVGGHALLHPQTLHQAAATELCLAQEWMGSQSMPLQECQQVETEISWFIISRHSDLAMHLAQSLNSQL